MFTKTQQDIRIETWCGEITDIDAYEFKLPSMVQKKKITNAPSRKMKTSRPPQTNVLHVRWSLQSHREQELPVRKQIRPLPSCFKAEKIKTMPMFTAAFNPLNVTFCY